MVEVIIAALEFSSLCFPGQLLMWKYVSVEGCGLGQQRTHFVVPRVIRPRNVRFSLFWRNHCGCVWMEITVYSCCKHKTHSSAREGFTILLCDKSRYPGFLLKRHLPPRWKYYEVPRLHEEHTFKWAWSYLALPRWQNTRPAELRLWRRDSRWEEAAVPPSMNTIWSIWQRNRDPPSRVHHNSFTRWSTYFPTTFAHDNLISWSLSGVLLSLYSRQIPGSSLRIFLCDCF